MIGRKYLIISALVILISLAMVVPAIAAQTYSVTVSSYGGDALSQSLSPSKLSLVNEYSLQKPGMSSTGTSSFLNSGKSTTLSNLQSQTGSPAIGTVSAFSKYSQKGNNTFLEFSDSVSMSGSISLFEYTFSFT